MLRVFFFLAVGFGICFLWLHVKKLKKYSDDPSTGNLEPMVKCNYCSIYTPQKNTIKGIGNHWYCCLEHKQKAEK